MNTKNCLRLQNVTKLFQHSTTTIQVLNNVTHVFNQGTTTIITGRSGTGKSTLLYMLAGLDEPTQGMVYYNEQPLSSFDAYARQNFLKKSLGLVFQTSQMLAELSVIENVMLKGLIEGQAYKDARNHALYLLTTIGLADKAYIYPCALSGGEQQRIAIIRALFTKPDFLIIDEPTSHLDEKTGDTISSLLRTYQREYNMSFIIVSHDPRLLWHDATILRLEDGLLYETVIGDSINKSIESQNLFTDHL